MYFCPELSKGSLLDHFPFLNWQRNIVKGKLNNKYMKYEGRSRNQRIQIRMKSHMRHGVVKRSKSCYWKVEDLFLLSIFPVRKITQCNTSSLALLFPLAFAFLACFSYYIFCACHSVTLYMLYYSVPYIVTYCNATFRAIWGYFLFILVQGVLYFLCLLVPWPLY